MSATGMSLAEFSVDDIPSQEGKVIVVTGGTNGLGASFLTTIAAHHPAHLIFTGRSSTAAETLIQKLNAINPGTKATFVPCDLSSLKAVNEAGREIAAQFGERIDVVVCNAGIMAVAEGVTEEGIEVQFGVNHLGHAALLSHLLPPLHRSASSTPTSGRVILLTSLGYLLPTTSTGISFTHLKTPTGLPYSPLYHYTGLAPWSRYAQSKLANVLYGEELAAQNPDLSVLVIHPGVIATDLVESLGVFKRWFVYATNWGKMVSREDGVKNHLWATVAEKGAFESGAFYEPVGKVGTRGAWNGNGELRRELWEWTETALKESRGGD